MGLFGKSCSYLGLFALTCLLLVHLFANANERNAFPFEILFLMHHLLKFALIRSRNVRNGFFSFPSRSRILGMGVFHSLPAPELREWNYPFPFPFPNSQMSFLLTPVMARGRSWMTELDE